MKEEGTQMRFTGLVAQVLRQGQPGVFFNFFNFEHWLLMRSGLSVVISL